MGKFYDEIPGYVIAMIKKQHMFWVATAPLSADGHVNISSKGVEGTFHIIDSHTVWYEDLSGSGVETISHLRENGRITILFNAFEGPPSIVRLLDAVGQFYEFGTSEYNAFIPPETRHPGSRAVIMVDVHKVGTSCGYAVPFYEFKSHRTRLLEFAAKFELADIEAEEADKAAICQPPRPDDGLKRYWIQHNVQSIDGLPGMTFAQHSTDKFQTRGKVYKKDDESVSMKGYLEQLDIRFILGFSLGIAATAASSVLFYHR
ncbi:hypothetical protein IW262DRAFT_1508857 [Armillaria fumosa]|nr:hypothetical protein IW262DRAFT_1508857 [Armillaria fumosa]